MTALDTITSKFDELVKCTNDLLKAVLSGSYEKELGLFANSQEDVRKEWASSIVECDHLKSEISTISDELSSTNRKLEEERKNRIILENKKFQLEKSLAQDRAEVRQKCLTFVQECERLKSALDKTRDDLTKSRQLLNEERKKYSAVEEEKIKLISKNNEIEEKLSESIKQCEILKIQLKQNEEDSLKLQQLFEEEKKKNLNNKNQEQNNATKIEEIEKKLSASVEECEKLKTQVQLFENEKKIYHDEEKKQEKKKAIEIAELEKKISSSAEEYKQLKIELEKSKNESMQSLKYLEEENINYKNIEIILEKKIEELQKELSLSVNKCKQSKIELKKVKDEAIKTELLKILEQSEKDRCQAVIFDEQTKKIENLKCQLSTCTMECAELKTNLNKTKEELSKTLKLYDMEKKKYQETYVEKNHLIKQIENIGDVQDKLLASLQECDRLKDELEKAQEEAISTHQQLDDEKQKYCTLENEKNQLKKQISINSEVQKNLSTVTEECETLKLNTKNLQKDLDNCRQQLNEEKQKYLALENKKNQMNKNTGKNCECEENLPASSLSYEKLLNELKKTQKELIDANQKLDYEKKKCTAVEHKKNKLERQMTIARDMLVIEDCQDVINKPLEIIPPPVCQVNENVCSSFINTKNENKTIGVKNTTANNTCNESVVADFNESVATDLNESGATNLNESEATDFNESVVTDLNNSVVTDLNEPVVTDFNESAVTSFDELLKTDNSPLKPADNSSDIDKKLISNKRKRKQRNSSVEITPKKQKKTSKKSKKSNKKINVLLDNEEIDKLSVENSKDMDFDDIDETFVVKFNNPNKKNRKNNKKNSPTTLEEKNTSTCTSDDEFEGIFEEVDETFVERTNDSSKKDKKNNKKNLSVKWGEVSTFDEKIDELLEQEIDETLNDLNKKNRKYNKKNVTLKLGEESTSKPDETIVEKADEVFVEKLNNSLNKKTRKNIKKNVSINLGEESTLTSDEQSNNMIVNNIDGLFGQSPPSSNKKSKKNKKHVLFKLGDEILSTSDEKMNEIIAGKVVKKKETSNKKNKKKVELLNLEEKAILPVENEMIIQEDNKLVSQKLPGSNKKYKKKNLPPSTKESIQATLDKFKEIIGEKDNETAVQKSSNKKYQKKIPTRLEESSENPVEMDEIVIENTDPLFDNTAKQIEENSIETSIDEPAENSIAELIEKPFDQTIDKLIENDIDYSLLPSPKSRKIRSSTSRTSIKKPQQIEQKQMNNSEIEINNDVAKNPLENCDVENPNKLKLTPKIDSNHDNISALNGLRFDSPIVSLEKLRATNFKQITQRVKRKMNISSLTLSD